MEPLSVPEVTSRSSAETASVNLVQIILHIVGPIVPRPAGNSELPRKLDANGFTHL